VSVAALLRREGRGPHVADRPLVPRGHARVTQPPPTPSRHSLRKVAVAAGALFAATAVLAPSVVEDSAGRLATGQGTDIPLLPEGTQHPLDFDWFSTVTRTDRTYIDDDNDTMTFAAMRQVFAAGIPSDVGHPVLDRNVTEPAGTGRHVAVKHVQTPDRARAGSTDPAGTPRSGTVPPGGAGTPPGGTWSYAAAPYGYRGQAASGDTAPGNNSGGGPLSYAPAGARSSSAADTPGNGPPSHASTFARSNGAPGSGSPADKPGNGPPSSTPASTRSDNAHGNGPPDGVGARGGHGNGSGEPGRGPEDKTTRSAGNPHTSSTTDRPAGGTKTHAASGRSGRTSDETTPDAASNRHNGRKTGGGNSGEKSTRRHGATDDDPDDNSSGHRPDHEKSDDESDHRTNGSRHADEGDGNSDHHRSDHDSSDHHRSDHDKKSNDKSDRHGDSGDGGDRGSSDRGDRGKGD
jgi:hypothetical protein